MRAMMNKRADVIDTLMCLIFGMVSIGGWLWIYSSIGLPV
jgi:cbb3-type cytochrome oxidase subunit 3